MGSLQPEPVKSVAVARDPASGPVLGLFGAPFLAQSLRR